MRLLPDRSTGLGRRKSVALGIAVTRLFSFQPAKAADTQSTWINAASANWTTSGDWSNTSTFPQNGSKKYQATINPSGSAPYSVLANSTIAVDSLTVSAANATLLLENPGTLTLQSLNLAAGTVDVMGGTLAGATGGATLTVAGSANFETSFGTVSGTNATPTLSNVNIAAGSQVNIATGSTLNYSGVNSGTIAGSNATLNLQGNMTLASFGTLNLTSNSLVDVAGSVALQSTDVFSPGTATLPWNLNGGTITGGTLAITPAQNFSITSGTLSGVTVQGLGLIGTSSLTSLNISGGLDGAGQTLDLTSQSWSLDFIEVNAQISNVTITNANGPTRSSETIFAGPYPGSSPATLTVAATTNVQSTAGQIAFQGAEGGATVNNYGSLSASGAKASIGAQFLSVFNNYANVSASNGSTANFSIGDLYNTGTITANHGTLTFNCNLVNYAGGTITASNQSTATLESGFNNYGTLTVDDSTAAIQASSWYNAPNATINVQNGGVLSFVFGVNQGGTFHLSGGALSFPPGYSLLVAGGTLSGSGTINSTAGFSGSQNHLAFDIGGTTQGTGYDSLSLVALSVDSAELDVTVTNGFASSITPQEKFVVVQTTEGVGGVFTNIANGGTLLTTDGRESFQANYGTGIYADEVILSDFQIIPEPSLAAPFILVPALLMARRRHRVADRGYGL